jgi:PPM family protein phosphatase
MVALRWGSLTDVGRSRSLNEDAIVAEFPVFAVADGMGGHAAGEVASQLTADHLADLGQAGNPTGERLVGAIRAANSAIFRKSIADPMLRGMGTTVCALSLVDNRLAIANVGDSRVYTVRNGQFSQVSQDHSYVAELVDAGEITWAQARSHPNRNIVTRALGIEPDVDVDLWEIPAVVGDRSCAATAWSMK